MSFVSNEVARDSYNMYNLKTDPVFAVDSLAKEMDDFIASIDNAGGFATNFVPNDKIFEQEVISIDFETYRNMAAKGARDFQTEAAKVHMQVTSDLIKCYDHNSAYELHNGKVVKSSELLDYINAGNTFDNSGFGGHDNAIIIKKVYEKLHFV